VICDLHAKFGGHSGMFKYDSDAFVKVLMVESLKKVLIANS